MSQASAYPMVRVSMDRAPKSKGVRPYASQQAATRLPRVFTPTLRLPPPIFCCGSRQAATFDDLQHVEISDCPRSGAV